MSCAFLLSKCLAESMSLPDRYREYAIFGVRHCEILAKVGSSAFPSNIQLHLGRVPSLGGSLRLRLMSALRHDILSLDLSETISRSVCFSRTGYEQGSLSFGP